METIKKKQKKNSVTRSVGDLLPITFHVPVEKADSHGSGSCFVNTQMLQPLLLMQIWIFMSLWGSIRRQNCFSFYAWLERNDCGRYETWVCSEAQAGGILKKVSNFSCTASWSCSVGPILFCILWLPYWLAISKDGNSFVKACGKSITPFTFKVYSSFFHKLRGVFLTKIIFLLV